MKLYLCSLFHLLQNLVNSGKCRILQSWYRERWGHMHYHQEGNIHQHLQTVQQESSRISPWP